MHFSQVSAEFADKFFELVDSVTNIAVTAHVSPDSDSIASVLSVYEILTTKYPEKNIRIIYSAEPQDHLRVFQNHDKIEFVPDIADHLDQTELLLMLDGGQYSRFSIYPEKLHRIPYTICIDHHPSPISDFSLSLVVPSSSSCAQLVYLALCGDLTISPRLAEVFLLGILGDTGNFNYLKPNQTEILTIAKKMIEIANVEIQEFQSRYQSIPKRAFELVKELMKNTVFSTSPKWPDYQYSFIDKEVIDTGEFSDSEISEACGIYLSHFLRTVKGFTWGFVITPRSSGECSISLRSLPRSVSVRDLMERTGLGGGHDRAAGGTFKKTDKDVEVSTSITWLIKWLGDHDPVLS
ncbi:MAG: DHHA1 domain protein [Candidatus Collierbacteria bacterium GW2011_GWD2_45_10]|nr:MAG: DHHA1 domain protein [Candidatus Collierbacteria bacterium GW2011_GWD2_45_10]